MVAATLITGVAWGVLIPGFESPDESFYYKAVQQYAALGSHPGLPLYDILLSPIVTITTSHERPFQIEYNPSFRFVSNRYGRVNMFMHGHSEKALRADLARLILLRAVTLSI